jgi:anti-sigma factor RsiW
VTCRELTDFLMDYLDGLLPPDTRLAFERHLAVCPPCVAYLESYKRTTQLAAAAFADRPGPAPLPPAPEGLIRAILAARAKSA